MLRSTPTRIAWLFAVTLLIPTVAHAAEGHVYFYDPDANHKAILNIASSFNAFFANAHTEMTLQPVVSAELLESLIKDSKDDFLIVSSGYLKRGRISAKALLVPTSNGDPFYRKMLVDRGKQEDPPQLGSLAVASGGDPSGRVQKELLESLRQRGLSVGGTTIIPVSKDIDALLALSFGQVQSALVTSASVDVLKKMNPTSAKSLRVIFESAPILRTPLCALDSVSVAKRELIVALFAKMTADPDGQRAMKAMGLDAWIPFDAGMMKK